MEEQFGKEAENVNSSNKQPVVLNKLEFPGQLFKKCLGHTPHQVIGISKYLILVFLVFSNRTVYKTHETYAKFCWLGLFWEFVSNQSSITHSLCNISDPSVHQQSGDGVCCASFSGM